MVSKAFIEFGKENNLKALCAFISGAEDFWGLDKFKDLLFKYPTVKEEFHKDT